LILSGRHGIFLLILQKNKMKRLIAFLTGCALLSQPGPIAAQGGVVHGPTIRSLFSTVMRSPAFPDSSGLVSKKSAEANKDQLKSCCQKIVKDMQRIYYLNSRSGKMKLQVRGIYIRGAALFFSLKLINRSSLDYAIDSIRFFIAEKQKGGHPPLRLNELSPVYVYDSARLVKGHSRVTSVIVVPRLTLARRRRLQIEVLEKNGGRQLQVQAADFTLENARLI
jgi:hypothetical protein